MKTGKTNEITQLKSVTKGIKTFHTPDYVGILLLNEEDLNSLRSNSGGLAESNEYQAHYWYAVMRKQFEDGSIVDIAIPTLFFNYSQKVTSATIDFQLEDVESISKATKKLHNEIILDLSSKLKEFQKRFNLELMSVNLGTIHKHPSGGKGDNSWHLSQ